jgi:hypothetical protein
MDFPYFKSYFCELLSATYHSYDTSGPQKIFPLASNDKFSEARGVTAAQLYKEKQAV